MTRKDRDLQLPQEQNEKFKKGFKRFILLVLTLISLIPVLLSLVASVNEPQVQTNLELYATNLLLQASEIKTSSTDDPNFNLNASLKAIIGEEPYITAKEQYQEAKKDAQNNLDELKKNFANTTILSKTSSNPIQEKIEQQQQVINKIALKLSIIQTQIKETDEANKIWNNLIANPSTQKDVLKTAVVLKDLWSESPQIPLNTEKILKEELEGWFRFKTLEKYYQIANKQQDLSLLQSQEQEAAAQVLVKFALLNAIPVIGGIVGFSLVVFLLIQFLTQKKESLLASINNLPWQTPWTAETIWQVLIVGFFFIGQIALPFGFGLSGFDPTNLTLRGKAYYVLISYIVMSVSGLLVLYFSIKPFFPLPQDWFRFQWLSNWILWGLGGYLVAIPLVFTISLVNQQFWQGQGGSNPLLFLALEAQDKVVLAIFFFTASIAAPIFEEIMFRGFLLPSLTRYVPVWGAIVISSLVFALAHLSLSEVLPLAILGIVLGVVYTRSRNLLSSMLLHSLWNSGTLISLFVLGSGAR
jgi:uncharacterized protein